MAYSTNPPPRSRALLASPFVPFIVLFCHIIETSDPEPLEDLAAVVDPLVEAVEHSQVVVVVEPMFHRHLRSNPSPRPAMTPTNRLTLIPLPDRRHVVIPFVADAERCGNPTEGFWIRAV